MLDFGALRLNISPAGIKMTPTVEMLDLVGFWWEEWAKPQNVEHVKLFGALWNLQGYHRVGNYYLINSKKLQIGIGIGKFSMINSEELHIGNFLGGFLSLIQTLKGDRNRYR